MFIIDKYFRSVVIFLFVMFVIISMIVINLGIWFLNCMVISNYDGGMYVLFNVIKCDCDIKVLIVSGGCM